MKNPSRGTHPDLFEGESRIYVPLDDLSEDEIVALPRKAFSEDEWDELGENLQWHIYDSHEEDRERAEAIMEFLKDAYENTQNSYGYDESSEIEVFEQWLNEQVYHGEILDRVGSETDDIISDFEEQGFHEAQIEAAIKEALEDQNNWDVEISDSSSGTYHYPIQGSIYIDSRWLNAEIDWKAPFFESDISIALDMLKDESRSAWDVYEYGLSNFTERLWKMIMPEAQWREMWRRKFESYRGRYADVPFEKWPYDLKKRPHGALEASPAGFEDYLKRQHRPDISIYEIDTELFLTAEPNWDYIRTDVTDKLESVVPGKALTEQRPPEEDNRIMELADGFYVADLSPQELPLEGKKMGICVGQPSYGYGRAVMEGGTKILSLRRPSGKPLLTFEVEMDGDIFIDVVQIKGKGNRLPGWDRGGTGRGQVKEHEVRLATEVVKRLGIDPEDVEDLQPGYQAVFGDDEEERENPHRPSKTFSDPPGRLR